MTIRKPQRELLTQNQENFCNSYIECGNASEALRRSYDCTRRSPETVNRHAKKLLDNVKVMARINELRQPAIRAAMFSLEDHLVTLEALRDEARELGQITAAVAAETARAKAAGVYSTTKVEITGGGGGPLLLAPAINLANLNDEELEVYGELSDKVSG